MLTESKYRDDYGFFFLFIGALIFYCQQSWVPGFFQDGYLYAGLGKNAAELNHWLIPFQSEAVYQKFSQHPPLFFIIEGLFFKLFGSSFTAARLFGASWAVSTLTLLYFGIKKLSSKKQAFWSCVLFLIIPAFIKKSRFPNLDIPLTFLFTLSYFLYYQIFLEMQESKKTNRLWSLLGFVWGLSLLLKGPPGMMIGLGITLHLLITKKFILTIKSLGPWLCVIVGVLTFSIWPLALYIDGSFSIFTGYIHEQLFSTLVESRGTIENDYFLYIKHLFKTGPLWSLLLIWGIFSRLKNKKIMDPLYLLFLCWFVSLLIPFSLMKFKYSHYVLPLMPAFAVLAAYSILSFSSKVEKISRSFFKGLIIVVGLALLIFPLTNKSKRDPELFEISYLVERLEKKPLKWVVVENAYPFWSFNNFAAYRYGASAFNVPEDKLISLIDDKNSLFLVRRKTWSKYQNELNQKTKVILELKKKNILVLVSKELFQKGFFTAN